MNEETVDVITEGFADEIKSCILPLRNNLMALEEPAQSSEALEEISRIAGTVYGAASLVGVWISDVALEIKQAAEDVLTGKTELTPRLIELFTSAVSYIEIFSEGVQLSKTGQQSCIEELAEGFGGLKQEADTGELFPVDVIDFLNDEEDDLFIPEAVDECEPEKGAVEPELLVLFYQEAEEHLESIRTNLLFLEGGIRNTVTMGQQHRESVRQIRRSVHTIKGAGGLVGLGSLAEWAHHLEDLLDWLFETAVEISPDLVALLTKCTDILDVFLESPEKIDRNELDTLKDIFRTYTGTPETGKSSFSPEELNEYSDSSVSEPEKVQLPVQERSLRVGMERFDDLVNLVSEQIIALSAFDQSMDQFRGAVNELDLSRNHLRQTTRKLEAGYEVKAIRQPGAPGGFSSSHPVEPSMHSGDSDLFEDFDPLELDRYSEFNMIIRALSESAVDIGAIHTGMRNFFSDFDGYLTRQRVLLSEFQDKLMRVRMTPMGNLSNRMRRTVRDISEMLNKKVRLDISGEKIELDSTIWNKLADPLMHILRNAVDHGIESAEERRMLGKPETGTISVEAYRQGNQVVMKIVDDGAGIDLDAIQKRAEKTMASESVESLSQTDLTSLIFHPGFTTKESVSETSGRGVGMDVVKENLRELKGDVSVETIHGKSTIFTLRIPLTLAVVRAVLFKAGGQTYAAALNDVSEIVRVSPEIVIEEPQTMLRLDGRVVPLYSLTQSLGMTETESDIDADLKTEYRPGLHIVIGGKSRVFVIDSLLGQKEIVLKNLGSHLKYVRGISGATIMGDGSLIPIINVEELFNAHEYPAELQETLPPISGNEKIKPLTILVVDDSVSIRQFVSRLMQEQGWQTMTAKNGAEALERLHETQPDLIVLDIEMPRMNGFEFLNARRADKKMAGIPVIMLTSRSTEKYRVKAGELGADAFVVKPFNDETFIHLVRDLAVSKGNNE